MTVNETIIVKEKKKNIKIKIQRNKNKIYKKGKMIELTIY